LKRRRRRPFPNVEGQSAGRKKSKPMQRLEGHVMVYTNYFADDPTYTPKDFRQRFRIHKEWFKNIVHGVREFGTYLEIKRDAVGVPSFS
jgi:hypothetical protein